MVRSLVGSTPHFPPASPLSPILPVCPSQEWTVLPARTRIHRPRSQCAPPHLRPTRTIASMGQLPKVPGVPACARAPRARLVASRGALAHGAAPPPVPATGALRGGARPE